jgi:N4-gp56 family major capsid protein
MVRQAVTKLRANQAQPRDGQFYVGLVHPNVVYDLRSETGSGGWRVPNEYGTDQNQIWNGEFGAFEGVRWIQNARIRQANDGATAARVHRSYIMGREALAKSVVQEPEVRIAPTTDRLSRFHGIGWYSDLDYQVYRTKALVVFESFSAAV